MYSLCLDCGATNVRAMVVDKQGAIVGKASQPNATLPGEENPEFHVWDADRIFRQLSECAVKALEGLNAEQVTAVTITTFGVDGTLVDDAGNLPFNNAAAGNAARFPGGNQLEIDQRQHQPDDRRARQAAQDEASSGKSGLRDRDHERLNAVNGLPQRCGRRFRKKCILRLRAR